MRARRRSQIVGRSVLPLTIAILLFVRPASADSLLLDRFRDYLEILRAQSGIPGLAVAIVGTTDILWEHAFGDNDVERLIPTRTDTLFHVDGLTEVFSASFVLQCVEEGRLALTDRVAQFRPDSADGGLTLREILSHTSGTAETLTYAYRPERLDLLGDAIAACTGESYRQSLGELLERLAMRDSVPGADAIQMEAVSEPGFPASSTLEQYARVLERLASPYSVASKTLRATKSTYSSTTLTPASGLISTVRDFAQFDLALKNGVLLKAATLAEAWQPPLGRGGQRLPHGLGWFVQTYNGEPIVWQFGASEVSSSLVIEVPSRGLTVVLMANSNGLAADHALAAGDVTVSPFARLFLGFVVR